MLTGPMRLSMIAALASLGATGLTLALSGLGWPILLGAALSAVAAGVVLYAAARGVGDGGAAVQAQAQAQAQAGALAADLERYRQHTSALRHDLRGVLSPALMMSDRLLTHADPAVQRAGTAVVRSIDRATALLADSRDLMAPGAGGDRATALLADSRDLMAPGAGGEVPTTTR